MDLLGERQFGVSRQHDLSHQSFLSERDICGIGTSFFNIGIEARLRPITSSDMAMTNRLGSEPHIACAHAVKRQVIHNQAKIPMIFSGPLGLGSPADSIKIAGGTVRIRTHIGELDREFRAAASVCRASLLCPQSLRTLAEG
jgi:hypothetical protein